MNTPFVCHYKPFVYMNDANGIPFIGRFIPSIGFSEKSGGFTLVELMVTLLVIAILIGIGVPGYNQFIRTNRLATATNDLVTDLAMARSEALKRQNQVALCPSNDGLSCTATAWRQGWAVFLDGDNNSVWSASDNIMKVHQSLPNELSLTAKNGSDPAGTDASVIVFDRSAMAKDSLTYTYRLCSSKLKAQRKISIELTGRTNLAQETCP